jgi:mannose-6-phosphate isomerase-like protein (cupin superfamily)
VERALALAAVRGVDAVHLLTTTAAEFFAKSGFERVDRSGVPPLVSEHAQFLRLCPSTATSMRRRIDRDAHFLPRDLLALRPDVPGAAFWAVALDRAMLTYFEVEPGARFERHSHEAEQITLVLEGELHFELEAGRVVRVGPGDVLAIPSGVPHAAWAGTARTRAVDAWSPPRES